MKDNEFRMLLDLRMVSDPWPLDEQASETMLEMLNRKAALEGYMDWVDAYHRFRLPSDPQVVQCAMGYFVPPTAPACKQGFVPNCEPQRLPRTPQCEKHCVHYPEGGRCQ